MSGYLFVLDPTNCNLFGTYIDPKFHFQGVLGREVADLREEKPYTVSGRIRDVTDASYTVTSRMKTAVKSLLKRAIRYGYGPYRTVP